MLSGGGLGCGFVFQHTLRGRSEISLTRRDGIVGWVGSPRKVEVGGSSGSMHVETMNNHHNPSERVRVGLEAGTRQHGDGIGEGWVFLTNNNTRGHPPEGCVQMLDEGGWAGGRGFPTIGSFHKPPTATSMSTQLMPHSAWWVEVADWCRRSAVGGRRAGLPGQQLELREKTKSERFVPKVCEAGG